MKLHLGCFDLIKSGWLNLDIQQVRPDSDEFVKWDLRNGLPPQAKELTCSYSSHLLEHLLWPDTIKLLQQLLEVTVPGGKTRHCIPDFKKLVTKYLQRDFGFFAHCASVMPNNQLLEVINYSLYQRDDGVNAEHLTMFDQEYAIFTLAKAGWKDCKGVEFDPEIDYGFRMPYSFLVEGTKE